MSWTTNATAATGGASCTARIRVLRVRMAGLVSLRRDAIRLVRIQERGEFGLALLVVQAMRAALERNGHRRQRPVQLALALPGPGAEP